MRPQDVTARKPRMLTKETPDARFAIHSPHYHLLVPYLPNPGDISAFAEAPIDTLILKSCWKLTGTLASASWGQRNLKQ